jgi:hypothetical protein
MSCGISMRFHVHNNAGCWKYAVSTNIILCVTGMSSLFRRYAIIRFRLKTNSTGKYKHNKNTKLRISTVGRHMFNIPLQTIDYSPCLQQTGEVRITKFSLCAGRDCTLAARIWDNGFVEFIFGKVPIFHLSIYDNSRNCGISGSESQ